MWIVAGVLLGMMVLAAVAGVRAGPHAHVVSAVAGGAAALWLGVMAVTGDARPLLYVLLGADVTLSSVVGVVAWRALASGPTTVHAIRPVDGEMGVAVGDLIPTGVVRVRGEEWSAECVNGTARRGTPVQVLEVQGVRLRVWAESADQPEVSGTLPGTVPPAGAAGGAPAGGANGSLAEGPSRVVDGGRKEAGA